MCTAVAAHRRDLESSPLAGKVALWLGEGGASYGGFNVGSTQHNWLRIFGGGLSYLEDLGCAASNGAAVFARQQLSNFISFDPEKQQYVAFPAYWVALLWKQLVGTHAFGTSTSNDLIHVYAFDSADVSARQVLVALNWEDGQRNQTIAVSGCSDSVDLYLLTPSRGASRWEDSPVLSDGIDINGRECRVDSTGHAPTGLLQPTTVPCQHGSANFALPSLTAAFVVW
jgi:hypothetical protein|eukprot:SAG25_NODE_2158_length_1885_cov_2.052632_3_plen_227_part_00